MKTQTAQDIPLVGGILKLIFGTRNERFVRRYLAKVDAISAQEPEIRRLSDTELAARTVGFRERIENGENPFDLMVDAFATAREAMDRGVGIRNIFNPRFREQFDASRLTPALRELYERTRAAMDAEAPAPPAGDLLGCDGPVAGWERLDIPVELYDAVRELYPEWDRSAGNPVWAADSQRLYSSIDDAGVQRVYELPLRGKPRALTGQESVHSLALSRSGALFGLRETFIEPPTLVKIDPATGGTICRSASSVFDASGQNPTSDACTPRQIGRAHV